jgi:hypothetical protein
MISISCKQDESFVNLELNTKNPEKQLIFRDFLITKSNDVTFLFFICKTLTHY